MAIAFDAANSGSSAGAQPSLTIATTVTGSNTYGVVMASHDGSQTMNITGVTWNGVAMTNVNNLANVSSNSNTSLWVVANPTTGNVVISVSPNRQLYGITLSYTGANQTGQPDANNTTSDSTSPYTISTTTVSDNDWIICIARGGTTLNAGTNVTARSAPFSTIKAGDTNGPITPAGATTQTWTDSGASAETALLTVALKPVSATPATGAPVPHRLSLLGVGT